MHAYDPQGTLVNYTLDTDDPFDIDPELGRIFVSNSLDREVSHKSNSSIHGLDAYIFYLVQMLDAYMLVATVTDTEGLSVSKSAAKIKLFLHF